MSENEQEDQQLSQRARTIAEKLKERNQEKEEITTSKFYKLTLSLESKLVKMNLILTVISCACMLFDIAYGLAIWNVNYNMQLLVVEFIFFKIITSAMNIRRWVYLYKNKEASHPLNSICMMVMFAIVAVCMLMSDPPSDSDGGIMYVIIVTIIDMCLLVISAICILIMKRYTRKIFNTVDLYENYVNSMSIKLLKILPIPVDMEGEYIHFKEEEELRRQQEKLKKSKTQTEAAPANAPTGNNANVPNTPA